MPILPNARHERFAQALAAGKTADEAYQDAGYAENRGNATRLKANESMIARVAELLNKAAVKAEVTIDTIADMLREDRELARETKQVGAAVRAAESLGKLYGHYIERSENLNTNFVIGAEAVSREEWLKQHGDGGETVQ